MATGPERIRGLQFNSLSLPKQALMNVYTDESCLFEV